MSGRRVGFGRWYIALFLTFAASRAIYFALGVRLSTATLTRTIQLLPKSLLEHDFWRSIWNLHSQPPGFNAFIGLVLSTVGVRIWLFAIVYVLMGLALTFTMFALMCELGTPRPLAFAMTAAFMVSPITVLYENWLFYAYPVALMLCGAALCFARFARTHRIAYAAGFGTLLCFVALTRATYHVIAVIGAAAFVLYVCPRPMWRRALVASMAPLVLVAALYVKNQIQFGQPTASTWFGMNLAHMMYDPQSPELRDDVAAGRIDKQALVQPFSTLDHYPGVKRPHTGVPALDLTGDTRSPNYNNQAYIGISDQDRSDALGFIRRHPLTYAGRVADSYRVASTSAGSYFLLRTNRRHVSSLVSLQNRLLGQLRDTPESSINALPHGAFAGTGAVPKWSQISWFVVLQYGAVLAAGIALAVHAIRRRGPPLSPARRSFLLVSAVVVYASVVGNLVEFGENNRFRFETDPLVCIAVAALIGVSYRRWQARQSDVTPAPAPSPAPAP